MPISSMNKLDKLVNLNRGKLESVQYNSLLAIAGAMRGTPGEKLYQDLGLEPLKSRSCLENVAIFKKNVAIFNKKSPSYLFNLLPNLNRVHNTRLSYIILLIKVRHDNFKLHTSLCQ